LRKKIPTITRPDPAYVASLRQDIGEVSEAEKPKSTALGITPSVVAVPGEGERSCVDLVAPDHASQARRSVAAEAPTPEPSLSHTVRPTRKIDIRVNALARQEAALLACGVNPAHVVRAALRRAVKGWKLSPTFVPPAPDQRARQTGWQARTSLAVNTAQLKILLRDHDPLDVLSKWALIRGQLEPQVWAEIDAVLDEIAHCAAVPQISVPVGDIDR